MEARKKSPRRSIDRKLTLTVMLATGLSLLCAGLAFAIYDGISLRRSLSREASTLAEVIGRNSAIALAVDDPAAATQTLGALSAARPVLAASIYDREGRLFARYVAPGADPLAEPPASLELERRGVEGNHLDVLRPIRSRGEELGVIHLRLDPRGLPSGVGRYVAIVAMLLLAGAAVATTFAARLKRQISQPLADLVDGSEALAAGDLSIRVTDRSDDEIGVLARTFNAMSVGLRDLVTHIRQSISEVSEIARGLREGSTQMAREAHRQGDAIADTARSVAQMGSSIVDVNANVENLAKSAQETSESILELDSSITEIAEHMDQLAGSIETSSSAASQVAGNIDEVVDGVDTLQAATDAALLRLSQLGHSVGHVQANAEQTRELAEDSSREANQGTTAVNETIDAMREIAHDFRELQVRVSHLAMRSRSIDEIIRVIGDVADETTLLSLNAFIIAAQAGEHGKAFSVVADEVKSLAQRTQRSTREIAELTRAVQDDTAAAVAAVEVGSAKVEMGVERSHQAGEILKKILKKSGNSAARVRKIYEASGEQSEDLQRLERAMLEVKEIVQRIQGAAGEQQRGTSAIADAVGKIRLLGENVRHSTDEQRRRSGLITQASTNVTEKIDQIAQATQSQAASSETIQRALQTFRDVSHESTRRTQVIDEMVEALQERFQQLEREIGRFKMK